MKLDIRFDTLPLVTLKMRQTPGRRRASQTISSLLRCTASDLRFVCRLLTLNAK